MLSALGGTYNQHMLSALGGTYNQHMLSALGGTYNQHMLSALGGTYNQHMLSALGGTYNQHMLSALGGTYNQHMLSALGGTYNQHMLSAVRVHGVSTHEGDINMAKRSVHQQTVPTCGVGCPLIRGSAHEGDYCRVISHGHLPDDFMKTIIIPLIKT